MSTGSSNGKNGSSALFRGLPSVDNLLKEKSLQSLITKDGLPRELVVELAREMLDTVRQDIRDGSVTHIEDIAPETLAGRVNVMAGEVVEASLKSVINATGVILHTNLGRAPLSLEAVKAVQEVAYSYNNLEYDLESGERGSRMSHIGELLSRLCGAEDALVINNNAAAVYMVLSAFAKDREVILSRGQAVEIGGSFRIPDVMAQTGARLVEVGTTNKTYIEDYASAVTPLTSLLMRVHSSNFKIIGFTHNASLDEMAKLAQDQNLILVDDQGSGTFLDTARYGLTHEPTVQESIEAGVSLVTFSGDKLLGGPQAGLIAGKKSLISKLKKHPLARALRVDKMSIAALQVTLQHYLKQEAEQKIPVWQMISNPLQSLESKAEAWRNRIAPLWDGAETRSGLSTVGGGSLPGETLPTCMLALPAPSGLSASHLTSVLRKGRPPVICRIEQETLLFDPRTVLPHQEEKLLEELQKLARDFSGKQ